MSWIAKREKPKASPARLAKRTWGRAVVRRSTSGWLVRSSRRPQVRKATAAAKRPRGVALLQPHSPPLEMASSRQTRPPARPRRPMRSKRPPARTFDSGTRARTVARTMAPMVAEAQNRTCQLKLSATKAAMGRTRAGPMPREALTGAVDAPSPVGGQFVAQGAEAEGDDAGGEALDEASGDHRGGGGRKGT